MYKKYINKHTHTKVEDKCQHKMLYALKNFSLFPLVHIDVEMNIVYIFSVKKTKKSYKVQCIITTDCLDCIHNSCEDATGPHSASPCSTLGSEQTQLAVALASESPIQVFLAQSLCSLVLIHLIWHPSRNDECQRSICPMSPTHEHYPLCDKTMNRIVSYF